VLARSVSVFAQRNGVLFEVVNCANVSRSVDFFEVSTWLSTCIV